MFTLTCSLVGSSFPVGAKAHLLIWLQVTLGLTELSALTVRMDVLVCDIDVGLFHPSGEKAAKG